jgi:PAS domain S-box-containing protein
MSADAVPRATRFPRWFHHAAVRYLFGLFLVGAALALRLLMVPATGAGAPFVLFFAAVTLTSLLAGMGPGIVAVLLTIPLAARVFVVGAGYSISQAMVQAALFSVDGFVVIYLTGVLTRSRARTREVIELSPDAFFLADLDARFLDVNAAACKMLGYQRDELLAKTIFDIIPLQDAARLERVKSQLLRPGETSRAEWVQIRKDGTPIVVEVSSNILPGGRWQAFARDITGRRRLEDERQVFVSLLENSSDFIGIADPQGTPIYLNPAGRRMVGLDPDHPVEQTGIVDYYPPSVRRFAVDVILKSMIENGRWSGETWFRNWKTGEAIPVSDEHFMIRDASGERVLGMATVTRDITQRKEHEIARQNDLEALEGFYRVSSLFLSQQPPEAVLQEILDTAVAIAHADFGNLQILDPTSSRLEVVAHRNLPESWLRYWQSVVQAHGACGTALARGERVVVEDITQSPIFAGTDALAVQLETGIRAVQSTPLTSRSGATLGMISTHWKAAHRMSRRTTELLDLLAQSAADIIDRVWAERALRLSEAKSSGILSISADALISIDDQQRITMFNEGAEKIFGYSKDELLGTPLDRLIPERLRAIHRGHVESFARGEVVARKMGEMGATIMGLRKNGQEFPADAAISKLEVDGTRILTVALRDVTVQKSGELEIHRAVQVRDRVLGVVAHDLRNPLAAILAQSQALLRQAQPGRTDGKAIELIARAAARMNRLIQDLLDVTRIESGKLPLDRTSLAPASLTADAVDLQRVLAVSGSLDLRLELPDNLPEVWADRDRLLQVLENLIGNAIKFTGSGGSITVGAAPGDHEVIFWVKDTGCGITAENLPRVFERFWQAAGKSGRLGAGLGLPITKGIVEAHGGRIWAESAPGQGASFFFSIPTGRPEQDRPSYLVH